MNSHKECKGLKIDFLPIQSLEKYLKDKLIVKADNNLFSLLDSYVFQKKPLVEILRTYTRENNKEDADGKILYGYLLNELRSMRKDREDLVEIVVKYILENETDNVNTLVQYLSTKISQ